MTITLPSAYRQAEDIAEKSQALSKALKDIALENIQTQQNVDTFMIAITVFVLACFIGYYVVWKVTPALHTPLMSITNAISGIIIIGGMIAATPEQFGLASVCGYIAVMLAAINIFGGFVVTERMLAMFKKKNKN